MPFIDHRKNSRTGWGKDVDGDSNPSFQDIQLGCLLRIADATEAMAKRHDELIRENEYLTRRYRELWTENARLVRQRAALRGTVTRMKRAQQGVTRA